LTAAHLDPSFNHQITFTDDQGHSTTVQFDTSTVTQLDNRNVPNAGIHNLADLKLVRVAQDAANLAALNGLNLQTLNISTSTPNADTPITMAGVGSIRGSPVSYNVAPDPSKPGHFIWTQTANGQFNGYSFDGSINAATEKRWGSNKTSLINGGTTTR